MAYISSSLRQEVTQRANGLCEYCQMAQLIVVMLEIDHIVPEAAGGKTQTENLALICRGCNSFKQDFQTGHDPDKNEDVPLFNPRTQHWDDHFRWSEDGTTMIGLTSIGRATISRLGTNREDVLASRRLWVQVGWHPPKSGRFPSS